MQIIFYIMIYIIGVLLGSFFTLAIYRIPRNQDITHTRSYCPNCNHRLNFLDLIPILSYIFLKGKCRYCKQKISPRYIIIELISGVAYTLFIMSFNINIFILDIKQPIFLILITIYYSIIIIFAGIEKETKQISNKLIIFSFIFELIYITYLYIFDLNIYRYIIYIIITFILLLTLKKEETSLAKLIIISIFSLILINNYIALGIAILNVIINLTINYVKKDKKNLLSVFNICSIDLLILILSNFIN